MKVKEKSTLILDALGTTAGSVTGSLSGAVSGPYRAFIDSPYVFVIRHRASGALTYVGVIKDPGAKSNP